MALSREAQEALEELIRMMAKYGASNYRFDVGGALDAPPEQRLQAFDEAVQRMHAEAPSVVQNLASMPKDPYYQAMYGLAEARGARLGEATGMEDAALSQLAGATERGVYPPEKALALSQAYEASEEPKLPPAPQNPEEEYLAKRQKLMAEASKPVADLIRARSEAIAMGDEEGAQMADRWIEMLAQAVHAGRGQRPGVPAAGARPTAGWEGEEEPTEDEKKKFAERLRKLRERLRRLY